MILSLQISQVYVQLRKGCSLVLIFWVEKRLVFLCVSLVIDQNEACQKYVLL